MWWETIFDRLDVSLDDSGVMDRDFFGKSHVKRKQNRKRKGEERC